MTCWFSERNILLLFDLKAWVKHMVIMLHYYQEGYSHIVSRFAVSMNEKLENIIWA